LCALPFFCEGIRAFSFMWFGSVYSSLLIPTRLIIRTCSRSDKDGRFEGSSAVFIHYHFTVFPVFPVFLSRLSCIFCMGPWGIINSFKGHLYSLVVIA